MNLTPATPAEKTEESLLTPAMAIAAARKNWLIIVIVTAVVGLGVSFYTLGQKKIYSSHAQLKIDPTPPRPLGQKVQAVVDVGAGNFWSNLEYYETQYKIIKSQSVAEEVVRRLNLQDDEAFLQNVPQNEKPQPIVRSDFGVDRAARKLRGRINVSPVKNSRLVNVTLEDADPARAQRILAAIIETYMEQNIDSALESSNTARTWLGGQLDKLKTELESNEQSLHDYKKDNQILSLSLDDQSSMLRQEMNELNGALTRVRANIVKLQSRASALAKVDAKDPQDLPVSELLTSSTVQSLRQAYVAAKRDYDSLRQTGKGQEHPESRAAQARLDITRKALLKEIRNVQRSVKNELRSAQKERSGLAGLFAQAKKRALELNGLEMSYRRLERSKKNTEKLYTLVLERTKESDLTSLMRFNNISVVEKATTPRRPIRPRTSIMILGGIAAGMALGLGLAVGRELLDRSIKTPDDVERVLQLAFLGLLPRVDSAKAAPYARKKRSRRQAAANTPPELVVHYAPQSGTAEAARAIRTNLVFMSPDEPFSTLLITSAGPSEGKTTVACCIATAIAQTGKSVVIVDCDLRRPRVHKVFRMPNDLGVTTAMMDLSLLGDSDLSTDIENLHVLPSGPAAPNPAELLQSGKFGRLLEALEAKYDRVVLDSPPLAAVTDAAILSKRVDGTVVVVRARRTSRDLAKQATRSLKDVEARIAGVVLNGADFKQGDYQYYYRYEYTSKGSPRSSA